MRVRVPAREPEAGAAEAGYRPGDGFWMIAWDYETVSLIIDEAAFVESLDELVERSRQWIMWESSLGQRVRQALEAASHG